MESKQHMDGVDDTPMALLEQLVYMENFLQSAETSPAATTNATASANANGNSAPLSLNFNDQLQRELAAFADDTFIFPDEDKHEGSSSGNGGFRQNDLLSFADATSFDHISPMDQQQASVQQQTTPQIPNQTYQNLNQRYNNNKRKYDYHDAMQNNRNITTNSNQQQHHQQNPQAQPAPHSPIPSTIHELLGKNSGSSAASRDNSFNPSLLSRSKSSATSSSSSDEKKFQVPQGAQNTLSAAGLSQQQIDALASLVAFHKPEVYGDQGSAQQQKQQQQQQLSQQSNTLFQQHQQSMNQFATHSGSSTITANPTPLANQTPVQQQHQQPQQQPNNLLLNLLAQTLANAVQPQQQHQQQPNNLLTDLVVALANQQQTLAPAQIPQQQQQSLDALSLLQRQIQSPPAGPQQVFSPPPQNSLPQPQQSLGSPLAQVTTPGGTTTSASKPRKKKSPVKLESNSNSPLDSEEEKRLKVTQASARFRQKKKMKEQEMEKSLIEAHQLSATLEQRIQQLEMENRLLKNLIVEKSQRRDEQEVERLKKKAKTEANLGTN